MSVGSFTWEEEEWFIWGENGDKMWLLISLVVEVSGDEELEQESEWTQLSSLVK